MQLEIWEVKNGIRPAIALKPKFKFALNNLTFYYNHLKNYIFGYF